MMTWPCCHCRLQECMEKLSLKVETLTNQNLLLQKERDEAKADAAAALAAMYDPLMTMKQCVEVIVQFAAVCHASIRK